MAHLKFMLLLDSILTFRRATLLQKIQYNQRTDEIPSGLWPCAVGSPQVWEDSQNKLNKHRTNTEQKLTGAKRRVAGWVAGVAGMMKLLVMTGIIPENSLLSFQSPKKRTPNRRTCASAVTETFGGSENHG